MFFFSNITSISNRLKKIVLKIVLKIGLNQLTVKFAAGALTKFMMLAVSSQIDA